MSIVRSLTFLIIATASLHAQQAPFGGTPWALGAQIEAEHYDTGGAGVAYSDTTTTNTGAATLRSPDEVDIIADATANNGFHIQDMNVGEWLEYTVNAGVTPARPFANLTLRYRANYPKRVRLLQDGVAITTFALPATSSTTWGTLTLEKLTLTPSISSVMRFEVMESGDNSIIANKTTATTAEQWDVLDLGSTSGTTDLVAIRSVLTGRFLRVTSKDHEVYALSAESTGTQPQFGLIPVVAGTGVSAGHGILCYFPNPDTYLSTPNTTSIINAKASSAASNRERYTIEDLGATPGGTAGTAPIGRRVALRSIQANRYVSIANDGGLRLDHLTFTQWVNRLPIVNAGFNRTITWPATTATLSGTAQELDPSGSLTARAWTQISGPNTATMGTPSSSTTSGVETTTVALSGLVRGIYVFRFTATDDMSDSRSGDVEVAVIDEAQFTSVLPTDSKIQFFGRVHAVGTSAPIIGWSGAGFRVRFDGTGISVKVSRGSFPSTKQQFYAIIDGADTDPRIVDLNLSTSLAYITSGLPAGPHTLEFYSLGGAWVAPTTLQSLLLPSGTTLLNPPARPTRRIEFYGDSITEGGLMPDQPITNTYRAYAAQAGRKLAAEAHIMCKSGLGLVKTGNSGGSTLIGLHNRGSPWDSASTWNFNLFKPQVIVINILQNDYWLGGSDPDSTFITAYVTFLRALRTQHPNAHIVCALGAMDATQPGSRMPGIITSAVNTLRTSDRDGKLHTVFFPWLGTGTGHPSAIQAGNMADQLKAYLDGLSFDVWTDGIEAPTGYQSWLNTSGFTIPHALEAQPSSDSDGDGFSNLLEYALATSPASNALSTNVPQITPQSSGAMRFEFRRAATDLTYRVECSTTLLGGSWTTAPWPITDLGGGFSAVTVPAPLTGCAFFRLAVEIP
jgi:Carbohydrate esterase 2 N-terminal/GDSL-like Lipase/Acylhydrolase family/DUF5010 C-terminal domain